MDIKIHLAFRFHGNFYHSYRGDTPDELGFGKDIRIIRYLIAVLDEYNQRGIPVCGTWDFENYFSLEKIMPEYCPDIIAGLQRRIQDGQDEIQFMSYNNGLINAHTAREFEEAMRRAISNTAGSGLRDLFGEKYFNMVRPQEMMYTPIHLQMYPALGIDFISLFYSAVPFNGFSNFIPRLAPAESYNPLTLTYPAIAQSMTLLPAYNIGDLADHLTLRRWVKKIRRQQLEMQEPVDFLLLLDQDADDQFWCSFSAPAILKNNFSTVQGIRGLLENILDLDYVEFTTPGRYLKNHAPLRSISIGQDTADGSFDGLSSWTEKWSNHRLFTGLERARILDLQTRRLLKQQGKMPAQITELLQDSFEDRLKILSTTHFGMASPVMNLTREKGARELVQHAVLHAATAFEKAAPQAKQGKFSLLDYVRGESTDIIQYQAHDSRALIRLLLRENAPCQFSLQNSSGKAIACAVVESMRGPELFFVDHFNAEEQKEYTINSDATSIIPKSPVSISTNSLENEFVRLTFDEQHQVKSFVYQGKELSSGNFISSSVTYGGRQYCVSQWEENASISAGVVGLKRMRATLEIKGGYPIQFEREILLASGLPYVYVSTKVSYPRTPDKGFDHGRAQRLQQGWDSAWQETQPCELRPALSGTTRQPLRVWKHNYCDHISTFNLDYASFSRNRSLPNINNHITHAWVAVSDGGHGLLVAQSADFSSNVAFCPLRTRMRGNTTQVRLNPFGTYYGKQYKYITADTHLGKLMATTFSAADQLSPYAPSYNGRILEFSLLLAPYDGDTPPAETRYDAEAFAYPYIVLNDEQVIADPPHRTWDGRGLGEIFPSGEA